MGDRKQIYMMERSVY